MTDALTTEPQTAERKNERSIAAARLKLTGPVLGLVCVAVLINFFFVIYGGFSGDHMAVEREAEQIARYDAHNQETLTDALTLLLASDEAYNELTANATPSWFQAYTEETFAYLDVAKAFVLGAEDEFLFGIDGGAFVDNRQFEPYRPTAAALVAEVRTAERTAMSDPTSLSRMNGVSGFEPVHASDIANVNGQIVRIVATLVQPNFLEVDPDRPQGTIVVTTVDLNNRYAETYRETFAISPFMVLPGDEASNLNSRPMYNRSGEVVGQFVWRIWRPGSGLLQVMLPLMVFMSCSVLLATGYFLRRSRQMASSLEASEAKAKHAALHDPLTGLANRTFFNDRMETALSVYRRGGPMVAVHCIDLDRFKEVNDTLGHHAGDELIVETAKRLLQISRATDTVARLGGDEFAIIQRNVENPRDAARLAERILDGLEVPYEITGSRLHISCSIGIALSEADTPPFDMLRQADIALYKAKSEGRAQYHFFETEMDASLKAKKQVETDLRDAIANDGLSIAYQPQVCSRTGELVAIEALLRWMHPVRGNISPGYFVPIAEEAGLIRDLGQWAFEHALEGAKSFPNAKVAINVSAAELAFDDYAERVMETAQAHNVPPEQIELEITESVLLGDSARIENALRSLRYAGFKIAIDDFGTGYSSLSYLRKYPVDKLKIDKSFVHSLGYADDCDAVVDAIIRLGAALNLTVVAEGVETREQQKALSAAGCNELQGYLFSHPVSLDEIRSTFGADIHTIR